VSKTVRPSGPSDAQRSPVLGGTRFRLGALIAILAIGGIVLWLALSGDDDSSTAQSSNAVEITPDSLGNLAGSLDQPIYWLGPRDNVKYELVRRPNQILVGYLPSDQEVGRADPHTVVGTYRMSDAYDVTQRAASKPGTVHINAPNGAVAFYNKAYPLSAFLSYPGSSYQIEVYDPRPGAAPRLVSRGRVQTVPGSPEQPTTSTSGPEAVTPRLLAVRATEARQPIYWAGRPEGGRKLELTRTQNGWYLVRYLPPGVLVGDKTPQLTVSTYPVQDAFAAVARLAEEPGAETLDTTGGVLAVANPSKFPNSVFMAFPGTAYQIEIFAPTLDEAEQVATSGDVSPVG
jgi:hypothetical protein